MAYQGYSINPPAKTLSRSGGGGSNVLPYLTAFTSVTGAISDIEQARTRRIISESNKEIAELKAKSAKRKGQAEESRSRQRIKQLIGKQRAALAAQGVSLEGEGVQDIIQETGRVGEVDALTIRLNAMREAFGYEQEARTAGFEGRMVERAGRFGAAETLLTGGLRAYEQYKGRR